MPSLGTGFGKKVEVANFRTTGGDVVAKQFRLAETESALAAEPPVAPAIPLGKYARFGELPFPAEPPVAPAIPLASRDYMNLHQAAEYTGLAEGTISNAISAGKIAKKAGSRKVIIERKELDRYLDGRPQKPKRRH